MARTLTLPGPAEDRRDRRPRPRPGRARSCRPPAGAAGRASASATVSMSGASPCGVMPEHGRDRGRDRRRVADRRQLDHPHAVGELAGDLGADLERQPGLADPADAGQRDQPVRPHELGDLGDHLLAADERAQLLREVARRSGRRCGAPGTRSGVRRRRPGTPTSVRADRGAGARPAAAAPRGRAAAPRSRPTRAPDRRARATSAAPRGSPRCRSSSGRVRSPHRCAAPCAPRSRRRCRRAAAPAPRSPRPPRRPRSRTRRRSRRHRCRTRSRRGVRSCRARCASWTRSASAMSVGASSHRRVESSMSVNRNVTVPPGSPCDIRAPYPARLPPYEGDHATTSAALILSVTNVIHPTIGPSDVLVRVRAAGVEPGVGPRPGLPYIVRLILWTAGAEEPNSGRGRGGPWPGRCSVTRLHPGDEVFGTARIITRSSPAPRKEAGTPACEPGFRRRPRLPVTGTLAQTVR